MSQLLVGVLIAVAVFILQELFRWVVGCMLFRQRLIADIESVVDDFRAWRPPDEVRLDPSSEAVTVAPIWDYGYENLGDVYDHSSSLMPDLFVRVIHFYSACGRFDQIRSAYNSAMIGMIGTERKDRWVAVLNGQLKDMNDVVTEIVSDGGALIASMQEAYWFVAQLHDLVTNARKTPHATHP
jgi:hypothetical protein